ncbi:MAG: cysteine desulfurase family protein [Methylovulum sp.]|nr:cysteine desulfurase family protein [Methylovulum sp.]
MIYLDHNATTPIDERVLDAMLPFLKIFYGNPSSLYRHGRLVRSAMDTAREQVAAACDANASQLVFTSSGTEANNMALATLSAQSLFAISAVEHPSVTEPAQHLKSRGHALTIIDVDADGLVTEESIANLIPQQPELVSIMLANNETGVIQDVAFYAGQLSARKINVHTDAVQALGKMPLSFKQLGVGLMSLSSHKIYGPKGCGALVFDKKMLIKPLLFGGGQEQGLRAGTENVAAIVGFGKAAELAQTELAGRNRHLCHLRDVLEQGLARIPGLTMFAQHAKRLPNTVQFGVAGVDGEMLLMKLDKKAIAVSSGSACASGGTEPSSVLTAMGVSGQQAKAAIRISLGKSNTEEEVSEFINVLNALVNQA